MDRCAIFLDAGYLYAEGGKLFCGSHRREHIQLDYVSLIPELMTYVHGHCGLQVLRMYWYDAAPNGIPTAEQVRIGVVRNVKLRLGRLISGSQKGVDSMIVRDLMTLARERAVATAYLLGGDEDLREGVAAAQDMGMRVVLLGVPTSGANQAATLIREADENVVLDADFLRPYFSSRMPVVPTLGLEVSDLESAESNTQSSIVAEDASAAWQAGVAFAATWLERVSQAQVEEVRHSGPAIVSYVDAQLLESAATTLGSRDLDQSSRRSLRAGFWHGVNEAPTADVARQPLG